MSAPPDYSEAVPTSSGGENKDNPPPYSPVQKLYYHPQQPSYPPVPQQPSYPPGPQQPSYPPGPQQPSYPPGPQQPSYPTGPQPMAYPPQQGYPMQYPTQQTGYHTQITVAQHGGIVTTSPSSTVIVRNTNIQPNDYMGLAIFVTVCCCLPFGIIGIMKASEAKNRWAVGDAAGAQASSRDAKRWSMFGLTSGIVTLSIVVIVFIVRFALAFNVYGY